MKAETTPKNQALDAALNELDFVIGEWNKSESASRDFQTMLYRICGKARKGLPLAQVLEQAEGLLRRKGTLSPLRDVAS